MLIRIIAINLLRVRSSSGRLNIFPSLHALSLLVLLEARSPPFGRDPIALADAVLALAIVVQDLDAPNSYFPGNWGDSGGTPG